MNKPLHTNN